MSDQYEEIKKTINAFDKWPEGNESLEEIMEKVDINKFEWFVSLTTIIESQNIELTKCVKLIDKWQIKLFENHILIESQKEEIEKLQAQIEEMELQGIIDIEQDEIYRG